MHSDSGNGFNFDLDHGSRGRRISRHLVSSIIAVAVFVVLIPVMGGSQIFSPDQPLPFFIRLFGAILLIAFLRVGEARRRARIVRDPAAAAANLRKEFDELTEPGWPVRVLRMGLTMGLVIGLSVGTVIALIPNAEYPDLSDRVQTVGLFLLFTFAWTLPAAFVIRWLSLASMRKFVRGLHD